jgi:hypothetical protein
VADPPQARARITTVRIAWRFALVAALLAGNCGEDEQTATRVPAAPSLRPAPAAVARACQQATGRAAFPVFCPSQWPPHGGAGQPKLRSFGRTADAYLLDASNGFSRRKTHVFHLRPAPTLRALALGRRLESTRDDAQGDHPGTRRRDVRPAPPGPAHRHRPCSRRARHGASRASLSHGRDPRRPRSRALERWRPWLPGVRPRRAAIRPALVSVALAMARSARPSPERRGSG